MRRVELLAPAKSYEAARAAVDHGADALYMGGTRFGARAAAGNSIEDIARAVEYTHQYGVRLYATLNTLIFEEEIEEAEQTARKIVDAGVDALIVQDLAFARMELGCELHASTQMCNSTPEGVRFLAEAGFKRVVLERNLTLSEIAEISSGCDAEIEAFVHGAICVGYSGQCYLSRCFNPSRSGNRGECSQPCRLSYDLVTGRGKSLIEGQHLLSVKDLNLTERVEDMILSGVSSLKIEGRLKDIGYTKNIVAHYRRVVDRVIESRGDLCRSSCGVSKIEFEPNPAKSFSRGGATYILDGQRENLASFATPKAMGEVVGEIRAQRGERIYLDLRSELSTGDGICFIKRGELIGGSINGVGEGWITLSRGVEIERGTTIHRNYDRLFEASMESSRTRRTIGVIGSISSTAEGVEVIYRDEEGYVGRASIEQEMREATNRERMEETIRTQLSKCGTTIFTLTDLSLEGYGGEFIPAGVVATLRREALTTLREARLKGAREGGVFQENLTARYPTTMIGGEVGVTNHLAEAFYRDHGVEHIAPSYERASSLIGAEVLRSSYCIRHEIGECLRKGSLMREELFLERGDERFRLAFDCTKCQMTLIKEQR